jgi:ATP-binding cassette subfamily B protein/subfamily B ATP-binding cassette protein MsbA
LLGSAVATLQPWPMKLVADHVLGPHPLPDALASIFRTLRFEPGPLGLLGVVAVGSLLLFALHSVVELVLASTWTLAGRRMVYDLAQTLFARLQRRSLLFHHRHPVGDTMSRTTGDSWCVYQFVDAVVFAPGHALVTMALMVVLMTGLDPGLTVLALAVAPFTVGASFVIGKPLHLAARLKREIEGRIQSHLQQTLTGLPVVQAFVQEEREQERFRRFASEAVRAQQRSAVLGSLNSLGSGLVATVGAGVILWFGARHVLAGTLTIGSLLVFFVYLTALQNQIRMFAGIHTNWRMISASLDRVLEMLEVEPEVSEQPHALPLKIRNGTGDGSAGEKAGRLESPEAEKHAGPLACRPAGSRRKGAHVVFDQVTFGYEPGRPVLREISFEVEPGQTVAIVGPTGVGKSTLVGLLPRFFDPWEGSVLVDGQDVRSVQLRSLREQIGLVLQEPFLFPITVAENIAYGRPEASRELIEAAARAAHAHEFIQRLPNGYDTVIGERGATLSGGERQRLAIARALLRDAPLLILDEPTSALDAGTEALLLEALERLMAGRTTFLIAHRLSTVRHADRILVLRDGRITESGTHAQLLEYGEFYAHLHEIQFRARKDEGAAVIS